MQAPTGIAMGESTDGSDTGSEPGALPCQLLDHGTGYLAAAAVFDGLRRQGELGGTHVRRLSLARTAWWLTSTTATTRHVDAHAGRMTTRRHGWPSSTVLPDRSLRCCHRAASVTSRCAGRAR